MVSFIQFFQQESYKLHAYSVLVLCPALIRLTELTLETVFGENERFELPQFRPVCEMKTVNVNFFR